MDDPASPRPPARLPALAAGFATLYLVWGSTYLGNKFAVETLPPLLMGGGRFTLAGLALYLVLRARGAARPTRAQWRAALLAGALLLLGGNGLVTWGQHQQVPSGRAALIVATTPAWMALVGWLFYAGPRPGLRVVLGIALGFVGCAVLVRAPAVGGAEGSWGGTLAILAAPVLWSFGSHQSRRAAPAEGAMLTSALQMIAGGCLMLVAGTCLGEWPRALAGTVSARSALAFAYLAVVGSLVGFTTYAWLLRVASPSAVVTYAYVNPLVAVLLGWLLGGEGLEPRVLAAAALIVGAVVLITLPAPAATPGANATGLAKAPRPRRASACSRAGRC